jgi:glycosyltransferase involved in cell wall biosynthesis
MARDLGIAKQVVFFGNVGSDVLNMLYRTCDVFCLPCHTDRFGTKEGFPTVIAEAMALGKPVVTTRHGEIGRVVRQILVDENDIGGLARVLEELQDLPELRTRYGEENRELALSTFSLRNAGQTLNVLAALASAYRGERSRP